VSTLTIAQAAEHTGLTAHTLRYYERDGLMLASVDRSAAGLRRYSDPSGGDLRLRHGSPARGGGLPALTPQYDRELRPRLAPSLGAYAH
jgi:hypothetical protein